MSENKEVAIKVNKNALQVDVGPSVIAALINESKMEEKAQEFAEQASMSRGEAIGRLTEACYIADTADEGIDLSQVFAEGQKDRSALFERLYIAIGVKEVQEDGTLIYAESVRKYFPPANATNATKETAGYKSKQQFQKNFGTKLKKAATAALGMKQTKAVPSFDAKAKVLTVKNAPKMIAGPDTGNDVVTSLTGAKHEGATKRASVEAFKDIAASKAGKAKPKGKADGGESTTQAMLESEDMFGEIVNSVIGALNSLEGNMTDTQRKQITNLRDRCNDILKA